MNLLLGDCVESMASLPDESVHLTVTSPPYDKIRDYDRAWSLDLPAVGRELYRVTVDGGMAAVVIQDGTASFAKSLTSFRTAVDWCDNAGWRLFETCIYRRFGSPGGWWSKRFRVDHEYILLFLKGARPRFFNKAHMAEPAKHAGTHDHGAARQTDGKLRARDKQKVIRPMRDRGTVWDIAPSNTEGNRLKHRHPATFPDRLAADLILCFSEPGDTILDPFMGSGTTCVQAGRLGRSYIGMDVNAEYLELARERLRVEADR